MKTSELLSDKTGENFITSKDKTVCMGKPTKKNNLPWKIWIGLTQSRVLYYVKNYVSGLSLVNTEIRDFQNLKSEALQGQSWAFNEVY